MQGNCCEGEACGLSQERTFALVGFNEMKMEPSGNSEDQPWKSTTRSNVDRVRQAGRNELDQGERILDVPMAEMHLIGTGDQVDPAVPLQQQIAEYIQVSHCFT